MRRRTILTGGAASLVAWPALAQQQQQQPQPQPVGPVIGFLGREDANLLYRAHEAFLAGMAENGYQLGRNFSIDYRLAADRDDLLTQFAAELAKPPVVAILAAGQGAAIAAKAATKTLPIVFASGTDGSGTGLIGESSKVIDNVTGTGMSPPADLEAQRLALLREIVPNADKVGVLIRPALVEISGQLSALQAAAQKMGVRLFVLPAATVADVSLAYARLAGQGTRAVIVCDDPFPAELRRALVTTAANARMPTLYPHSVFAESGGLLSFGPDLTVAYRTAGGQMARILKGAKPQDVAIQHPGTVQLVVNTAAAKAQGLTLPPSILSRANITIG